MIKPLSRTLTLAVGVLTSQLAFSATEHHRLVWDSDPAHEAVIGFSPKGYSSQPYVKYGSTTDERTWTSRQPDYNRIFNRSLRSYFVRLDGLTPDSGVYYRVCDQDGCGERLWFKTAPDDDSGFVAVAGGDTRATRTGETYRREGNRLISKVRPLFIMHGGDYTAFNKASEMKRYLTDWRLTFSNDVIDGKDYKRIYPFIPTHGNHEDYDFSTLCKVFGVDSDKNGTCNPSDTYGVVNVSPLMRVYTLNTQFARSGYGRYARSMNRWLENDLSIYGDQSVWRVAQYHRPLFPHIAFKGESPTQFGWWSDLFYDHNINLIVESDSHLTKATREVRPEGKGYVLAPEGGNIFVGEGSWGAPARSANDPKPWTLDTSSVQQVKVIQVTKDKMTVRTAQFDDTAATLSREQRQVDALRLPDNVNWWSLNEVGETMEIVKAASGLSLLLNQKSVVEPSFVNIPAEEDVFVSQKRSRANFNGHREGLLADAVDPAYGRMMSLISFDTQAIPECADIEGVKLTLEVTNSSSGSYSVSLAKMPWKESSATWRSVRGLGAVGKELTRFTPSSKGSFEIDLTDSKLISLWEKGDNYGLVIRTSASRDGLDFQSIETGKPPVLTVNFKVRENCNSTIETLSLPASDDTFITLSQPKKNFNGHRLGVLIDKEDRNFGKMQGLIKFDLSALPVDAQIDSVVLELNVTNVSHGSFNIRKARKDWSEDTLTWNSFWRSVGSGEQLTSFTATRSLGVQKIDLTKTEIVDKWLRNGNTGLFITPNTTNGLGFSTHELGSGPVLKVTYH